MTSLTNKIIGNIKKVSNSFNGNYINSNNVVSIDTLNNRIGINTKDPSYALHIVNSNNTIDTSFNNTIKSTNLIIDNLAKITNINSSDLSSVYGYIYEASFNKITNVNTITNVDKITNINNIITNYLSTNQISNFTNSGEIIFNNLSGDLINVNTINATNFKFDNLSLNISDLSVTNIDISNIANIKYLYIDNITSNNNIFDISDTCNFYKINILGLSNECMFFELSGTTIYATNAYLNTLDLNTLNLNILNFNNNTLIDLSNTIIQIGKDISYNLNIFSNIIDSSNIVSSSINTNNIKINESLIFSSNSLIDASISKLVLPLNKSQEHEIDGSIIYDNINNNLEIYSNNKWQSFNLNNEFASIKNITVNNVNFNNDYIYIDFDISNIINVEISNNNTIILEDLSANYEVYSNINLKYDNPSNDDVEIAKYTFGLNDICNNSYTETINTIIAFGNNINYANSSISYIGKIKKNTDFINSTGFKFYLKVENITNDNSIIIENFNAIIKKIN